jgi:hypothetical protein
MDQRYRQLSLSTGFVPDPPSKNDKEVDMSKMPHPTTLPAEFSLFDDEIDGLYGGKVKYQKLVYGQGTIGSCTPNAVAAAYYYELQHQGFKPSNDSFKVSRLFLYYVARLGLQKMEQKQLNPDTSAAFYKSLANNPPSEILTKDDGTNIREVVKIL